MHKTKLLFVLTSSENSNYIEQALLSVYTARYHNPDANIVLLIDDVTNQFLNGVRSEILNYITEKKVIEFDKQMSLMERSRWLKTSMRNLVDGDFLYIDCDTIITQELSNIDNLTCNIGAVLESHLPVNSFNNEMFYRLSKHAELLDWDLSKEEFYFSSGVIYVKDTDKNRIFFEKWHQFWYNGLTKGVTIDQPSFAKANIEIGHIVSRIDDTWNCIMYTNPLFYEEAKILHFCSFRNMSYIFTKNFLDLVRKTGINKNEFIKYSILNPYSSFLPFDNKVYSYTLDDYVSLISDVRKSSKLLLKNLKEAFNIYLGNTRIESYVKVLFSKKLYLIGAIILTLYKFFRVKLKRSYVYVSNTCSTNNL